MAITINYQIEFFSDWHLGSGLSVAGDVDSAVLRDENGLPYIPGKTLKGLLRHAADTLFIFDKKIFGQNDCIEEDKVKVSEFVEMAFGLKTSPDKEEDEDKEKPGQCFFSNAYLSENLQSNIKMAENSEFLYRKIASTKIDENGIAENHTLRKIEVTIPLVLVASIADVDSTWQESFKLLFQMVKRMGLGRHRGLGRCEFSIIEPSKQA